MAPTRANRKNAKCGDEKDPPFSSTRCFEETIVKNQNGDNYGKINQVMLHPMDVQKLIPEFSEGDVVDWLITLDHFKILYEWSEKQCLLYATTRLNNAARSWYARNKTEIKSWLQFKNLIVEAFPETVDEVDIHDELRRIRKSENESYTAYVYRIDEIARRGRLSIQATLKYIIKGLSSDVVYEHVLAGQYDSVLDFIKRVEWIAANLKIKTQQRKEISKSGATFPRDRVNTVNHTSNRVAVIRCFNCREEGHKSIECAKPQRKERCPVCLKVGHGRDQCFRNRNGQTSSSSKINTSSGVNAVHVIEQLQMVNELDSKSSQIEVNENGHSEVNVLMDDTLYNMTALVDSGSNNSLIKKCKLPSNFKFNVNSFQNNICGINESKLIVLGNFKTKIFINSKMYDIEFLVVPDTTMHMSVLLGRKFLLSNGLRCLRFFNGCEIKLDAKPSVDTDDEFLLHNIVGNVDELCAMMDSDENDLDLDIGDSNETKNCSNLFIEIFRENYLERSKPIEPVYKHKSEIRLKENKFFNSTPQRLSYFEKQELDKIIDDLLRKQIIRESESPYSSRVVMCRKKNNSYRMCVNYKPLNKLTERNFYPMPVIEDQILKLQGKKYFSSLDLKNGFYHIELEESSKKFTSFVIERGQYEFNRLPFGWTNSPAEFVRFITKILGKMIRENKLIVFVDDILVYSLSLEDHLMTLKELFQILSDNLIQINYAKCQFIKTKIEYLGYEICLNEIRPSDRHIESVRNIPVPTNAKSLQRFLGLVNYFRKFIKNFNNIASPLYDLIKKEREFILENEHLNAIDNLKESLISKPVLAIYSPVATTQLHTDASAHGFGGILMQQGDDEQYHPVMFFSRKTTAAESKLHSFELETLAIVYSLKRFRPYVFGIHFTVVTDCNSLRATLSKKDVNSKIARWALFLEEFDYDIIHRPCSKMQHVDALSRSHIYVLDSLDVVDNNVSNLFDNALYVSQLNDEKVQKLKNDVQHGLNKDFEIRDAILYKKFKSRLLLYIPDGMIESVLNKFHNQFGHFGVDKVCDAIKKAYYFPNMRDRVTNHIKQCVVCIAYNPRNKKFDGYLQNIDKGILPFNMVHIDHVGPLEITKSKNEYIFTVIDGFTKFIKLFATKSTNANEVMKALKSYFLNYSTPRVIVSDRGSAFKSKSFDKFVEDHGFKLIKVATACPKANGQNERYNRTIIPLLAKLVEEKNKEWDSLLTDAEFLLNNSLNRAIGDTPARILFGVDQHRNFQSDLTEFIEFQINGDLNRDRNLSDIRKEAHENIVKLQNYNKERYDSNCKRNTYFEKGDLVMIPQVPNPGQRNKLKPKHKGPYIVRKVLDKNRYVIADIDNFQISGRHFEGIFDPTNLVLYKKAAKDSNMHNSSFNFEINNSDNDSDFLGFD